MIALVALHDLILALHNLIRWLILVVGLVAILRAAWGWFSISAFARLDNALGSAFTGLIDLNVLIGIVLLILKWSDPQRPTLLHPLMMILAAAVAHGTRMLGRKHQARTQSHDLAARDAFAIEENHSARSREHMYQGLGFLVSFILILIGIRFVV